MARFLLFLLCLSLSWLPASQAAMVFKSELYAFEAEVLVDRLAHPWSFAFLPGGDLLITERGGRLLRRPSNTPQPRMVSGLPRIREYGQGGLLDVALDPNYGENKRIYLSYIGEEDGRFGTEVLRAELHGLELRNVQVIFRMTAKSKVGRHFGCRLLFAKDGSLFISLGDRGERPRAQNRQDHAGSLLRIYPDGSVPGDNPWPDGDVARPELYTWGNRNMQGLAQHPQTGKIYAHEHGPQGGDELNLMRAGVNYGWPEITYGKEYLSGFDIGEGSTRAGVQAPLHYWVPSIAPSGMVFYTGDEFPAWQGQLFVGSLKFGQLVRLQLEGERVVHEERMLNNRLGRIRDVRQGPDGTLYLLTDSPRGFLLRLKRKK